APAALGATERLDEVVPRARGDEREGAIHHGLMSVLEVDDGQPHISEPHGPRHVKAQVVGPAVAERSSHATQRGLVRATTSHEHAGYAAHCCDLSLLRMDAPCQPTRPRRRT